MSPAQDFLEHPGNEPTQKSKPFANSTHHYPRTPMLPPPPSAVNILMGIAGAESIDVPKKKQRENENERSSQTAK
jgi:hypothetical protein